MIRYVASFLLHFFTESFQEPEWSTKAQTILKFARQLTSILATTVESPVIALRLFLLGAQVADDCGFEDLAYDLYVQAFTVYEDSISESRAQLQAMTLVIGTLANARVFGSDNFDTLITKAALHGARLLKKSHQATAVGLASHLWWQEGRAEESEKEEPKENGDKEKTTQVTKEKEDADAVKAVGIFALQLFIVLMSVLVPLSR